MCGGGSELRRKRQQKECPGRAMQQLHCYCCTVKVLGAREYRHGN